MTLPRSASEGKVGVERERKKKRGFRRDTERERKERKSFRRGNKQEVDGRSFWSKPQIATLL